MKTIQIKIIYIILLALISPNINAQAVKQSAFTFNYNYQIPIGNLANNFGNNSSIGTSYFIELSNNIIIGMEGNFIFGGKIKDVTIFEGISNESGAIIGADGRYANVNLMQRGFDSYLFAGYALHFLKNNLSGIYITHGLGYLQHKIFIDTKNQNLPQLNEDMKKGYDRFSNGLSTKTSIDYKYYNRKGRFQISLGLNYTMAYTQNKRVYDFAKNEYYSDRKSWDKLFGCKVEVIIPINKRNEEKFHYY